jgi:hypothetical protein
MPRKATLRTRRRAVQAARQVECSGGSTPQPRRAVSRPASRVRTQPTSSILAVTRRLRASTRPVAFADEDWITMFRGIHRLLAHLYHEKTYIEIVQYLTHVEVNLILAGYQVTRQEIAIRFGTLFPRLGFQAAKGRNVRKFVYVQDVFGVQEPYALLKLECEDE